MTPKEAYEARKALIAALDDGPSRELDAAAKVISEWCGYSWDGLTEGRISDKGPFKPWCFDGGNHRHFQGGKQDVRDLVLAVVAALKAQEEA